MTADVERIGRYTLLRKLGEGGMAVVYLAHDPDIERDVAIKVIARQFLNDPEFRARFKREARLIAALDHSAIVPIFDYGEANEQPYIVMRYLPGGALTQRLSGQPLRLEIALTIIERLAQALDAAHKRGIIHRDIKPGNVLFDADGYAFLSDFGIAKLMQGATSYTQTGGPIGTPEYMSPEQAAGGKELDARSDIYSLGVIAYQLLTGRMPFTGDTPMQMMYQHVNRPVPPINTRSLGLPAKVNGVILKALAKKPEGRYASASEFATTLRASLFAAQARLPKPIPVPAGQNKSDTPKNELTPPGHIRSHPEGGIPTGDLPAGPINKTEPTQPMSGTTIPIWRRKLGWGLPVGGLVLLGFMAFMAINGLRGTSTPTVTPTSTFMATQTRTVTATRIPATPTLRPTSSATLITRSPTIAPTATLTFTLSPTPTNTLRPPTAKPANTLPPTPSNTLSPSPTNNFTSPTDTPSATPITPTSTPDDGTATPEP